MDGFAQYDMSLVIRSHLILWLSNKQFRSIFAPGAERLQVRLAAECSLWRVFVVELFIALQRGSQIITTMKTGGGENVDDAPVKTFNHAVGLKEPCSCW